MRRAGGERARIGIDLGKRNILGVLVNVIDHDAAVDRIIEAGHGRRSMRVACLAVHALAIGALDPTFRRRLNHFDIAVPDGQPVRRAMNAMYGTKLRAAVRAADLTERVVARAAAEDLPIFFYGNRRGVLEQVATRLLAQHPPLRIAGNAPSKFRRGSREDALDVARAIRESGARITFVSLGCPRQECFVDELADELHMPAVGVGVALDYLSGRLRPPPHSMCRLGLEWLWRLILEPRRLWRRYLLLNPLYLGLVALQGLGLWHPETVSEVSDVREVDL